MRNQINLKDQYIPERLARLLDGCGGRRQLLALDPHLLLDLGDPLRNEALLLSNPLGIYDVV